MRFSFRRRAANGLILITVLFAGIQGGIWLQKRGDRTYKRFEDREEYEDYAVTRQHGPAGRFNGSESEVGGKPYAETLEAGRVQKALEAKFQKIGIKPEKMRQQPLPLLTDPDKFISAPDMTSQCVKRRPTRGFLTIGIPSIRRPNTDRVYLLETLNSLVNQTSEQEQQEVIIVVLLSDSNQTYNAMVTRAITRQHSRHCANGFIRLIQPDPRMYPDFSLVRKTLNDPRPRVNWRAKQNVDFGFLMLYSAGLSDYYLQLEDDVITASMYIPYMKDFLAKQKKDWFLAEFSKLGFIGKLFHSSDVSKMAHFLFKFYDYVPGDILLGQVRGVMSQNLPLHSNASLFQHIGTFSSLANKMMPSIDKTFKDAHLFTLPMMNIQREQNPEAIIVTSLEPYENYTKDFPYLQGAGKDKFFWARSPKKGDHYSLLFKAPHNISRLIIASGDSNSRKDTFHSSELKVASVENQNVTTFKPASSVEECGHFTRLASLVDGDFDSDALGINFPHNVVCLKIEVVKNLSTWGILRGISITLYQ